MMPDCEVIRSTTVNLSKDRMWNINLNLDGVEPFNRIELNGKTIDKIIVKQCRFYDDCEDAVVVVFSLKNKTTSI